MNDGIGSAMGAKPTPEQEELLRSGINDDLSTQGVASARQAAADAANDSDRRALDDAVVFFPNGRKVRVADLNLDHAYLSGNHTSIFADTAKYLKNPLPGAMYVWSKKDDAQALAKVRAHLYRRVELDELADDCDLPISALEVQTTSPHTQKNPGKIQYVQMYDVQLMEVSPQAVQRLYRLPAAQAAMKAAGNVPFESLRAQVRDVTGGRADVEFTRREVTSPLE